MPHRMTSRPAMPPATEKRRLSVRHCWTSRIRPAPSAARVASSFSRATLRASIRFATFTAAISSTAAMPASRMNSAGLTAPTVWSMVGTTVALQPLLVVW